MKDTLYPLGAFALLVVSLFVISNSADKIAKVDGLERRVHALERHNDRVQEWEEMTFVHIVKLEHGEKTEKLPAPPSLKGD